MRGGGVNLQLSTPPFFYIDYFDLATVIIMKTTDSDHVFSTLKNGQISTNLAVDYDTYVHKFEYT